MIGKEKIYSQVNSVLQELGDDYISKLPKEIYDLIQSQKDCNYAPKYDLNVSLEKQEISKEALSLICDLQIRYLCQNNNDKKRIEQLLNKDIIIESNIKEGPNVEEKALDLTEYKENLLDKLLNKYLES